MISIQLDKMIFPGQHGMYKEEALTGNLFEVSVLIRFDADGKITGINQTVNYSDIYALIRKNMSKPAELLETLAQNIIRDIHLTDTRIRYAEVTITKKHPPILGFSGEISVTADQTFLS